MTRRTTTLCVGYIVFMFFAVFTGFCVSQGKYGYAVFNGFVTLFVLVCLTNYLNRKE
jgi:hypothetical protein